MKQTGEKVEIGSGFRDEKDQPLEPEEQPVKRTLFSAAEASAGTLTSGAPVGSLPLAISSEMSAFDAAGLLTSACRNCVHWRQDENAAFRSRYTISELRAILRIDVVVKNDDVLAALDDVDQIGVALESMGVCKALSSALRDDIVTHFSATCPDTYPNGAPLQSMFRSRDARATTRARDSIFTIASGRKP